MDPLFSCYPLSAGMMRVFVTNTALKSWIESLVALEEEEEGGSYDHLGPFSRRAPGQNRSKETIESLLMAEKEWNDLEVPENIEKQAWNGLGVLEAK
ncbi:hypothetical protein AAES_102172 [Amazona aestiva]|uniref:Uncharacterized protein n=1 Tax=Amazona aestiva TaxID=12930 RepID=A0A0Q3MAY1_AMAAE|nr:hypothetical protein AAES_102172 [Amazona aestiva]